MNWQSSISQDTFQNDVQVELVEKINIDVKVLNTNNSQHLVVFFWNANFTNILMRFNNFFPPFDVTLRKSRVGLQDCVNECWN